MDTFQLNDTQIAKMTEEMICLSDGNAHDINHFLKVHSYASLIARLENIDEPTRLICEAAAVIHDIACPICRIKYGHTAGSLQEKESGALVTPFLEKFPLSDFEKERIGFLVCHHHSPSVCDGDDFQILLEADFLVNAQESALSLDAIRNAKERLFRTDTGKHLLEILYLTNKNGDDSAQ